MRYKTITQKSKTRPLHDVIWELSTGKQLPPNWVVHHIDGNGLNNDLSNLVAMPVGDHVALHNKLRASGNDPVDSTNNDVIKNRNRCLNYRLSHKTEIATKNRIRYAEKKDHILAISKEWKRNNRSNVRAYNAQWAKHNPEKILASKRRYRAEHKDEISAKRVEYRKSTLLIARAYDNWYHAMHRGGSEHDIHLAAVNLEREKLWKWMMDSKLV